MRKGQPPSLALGVMKNQSEEVLDVETKEFYTTVHNVAIKGPEVILWDLW